MNKEWKDEIWFFDTEVLPHDWLLCAISMSGERFVSHNDSESVVQWLKEYHPILCGFNSKHYDQYILKGIMKRLEPEGVKEINDAIILKDIQGWQIDLGWIKMPRFIDLMLDLPTRPSLKLIEGNLGMDIRESTIDFNTEYPTEQEWDELVEYCWHDVEALIPVFEKRLPYLEAKESLANLAGLDVVKCLDMTNAKLTALYLKATKIERDDEREYVYPKEVDKLKNPKEIIDFFDKMRDDSISDEELWSMKGDFEICDGVSPTYGWGGCHFSLKNYSEEAE